jgi:hypothetical protein
MAIENVSGAGKPAQFHADITNQLFAEVKPRVRGAQNAADEAQAATQQTTQTNEQTTTPKTDEVTTTEPSAKAKIDTGKVDSIIKNMQESVAKLGDADYDSADIEKELAGLQEELGKFIGSYNDALSYAKESQDLGTVQNAADMVTLTAANQDPLSQLGIKVNENNTLEQMQSIAKMPDNKEAIAAMKDLFKGNNYSYAAKTMESVQGIFGA